MVSAAVCQGASCVRCGAARDLVAHHKLPHEYGGSDRLTNLEPVCRRCHPRAEADAKASAELMARIAQRRRRRRSPSSGGGSLAAVLTGATWPGA
ncbi:MAG: HNH endonuclease [Thermoleophilaceae bacterium]